jgi:CRISPR-associated endonuclease/helicase Cas3
VVVLIVESVPPSLRGELSKWMLEPKAGVFVGRISAAVRELLWKKACEQLQYGGCTMIYNAANEQGFAIRSAGDTTRVIESWEGLYLVRRLPAAKISPTMNLWAKTDPFQPLPCHLVDVGHVAIELLETATYQVILERFAEAANCTLSVAKSWLGYLAALHDWGKGWRNFQASGPPHVVEPLVKVGLNVNIEESESRIRHEAISRKWLEEHLTEWGGWNRRAARTVGAAIAAHHGRLGQSVKDLLQFPGRQSWEVLRVETEQLVREAFQPESWAAEFSDHSVIGVLLSGLVVFADWVASNQQLFSLRWNGEDWLEYVKRSRRTARAAVGQLGLTNENPWEEPRAFTEIWSAFRNPRPIQTACDELAQSGASPGLAIIEAPMGEGKSEAAIYLASQWLNKGGGMYIALPTAATSNQMFGRVRDFVGTHHHQAEARVQLVHGTSWLVDRVTPNQAPEISDEQDDPEGLLAFEWFLPRKRSLLATYGVGTVDQALMSVLHIKHGFLRLFGLAGKVLVIDEVHAYDAYMNEILTLLLEWCRVLEIPVILLSATLPQSRRATLISAYLGQEQELVEERISSTHYPLITYVAPEGELREIDVPKGDRCWEVRLVKHAGLLGDVQGVVDLAVDRIKDGGCLCIIVNTVDSAQAVYEELKIRKPDLPKLLFHARFPADERQRIENQALAWFDKRSLLPKDDPNRTERPRQAVLVATQVVEQSLDLDFDEMISEVAPIDLLLQRSGRLYRHERPGRSGQPVLHVLLPEEGTMDFGSSGRVYAPYILMRTCLALQDRWRLPDDMRDHIESVYGPQLSELPEEMRKALEAAHEQWSASQKRAAEQASIYLIPRPYPKAFKLDRMGRGLFEDDEGVQTYFAAKTRLGDRTMKILLVNGDDWSEELTQRRMPPHHVFRDMLLRTVNVPRWWFGNVSAVEPYQPLAQPPRWLRVERVLRLIEGCWLGRDESGQLIRIEVNPELGVRRLEVEG